jgi:hypothetical protein
VGVVFRLFESKGWLDAGGSFSPASMSFRRLRARFLHNRHCQSDAFAWGRLVSQCVDSQREWQTACG